MYQYVVGYLIRPAQEALVTRMLEQLQLVEHKGGSKSYIEKVKYATKYRHINNVDFVSHIYGFIMGGGKTKMISPILMLRFLQQTALTEETISNIYLILPEVLVEQSFKYLATTLGSYFNINICVLTEDREHKQEFSSSFDAHKRHVIYILSDVSLKCGMLNAYEKVKSNAKNALFIFDEVDSIVNPITSELNYPVTELDKDEIINKAMASSIQCMYAILKSIYTMTDITPVSL